MKAKTTWTIQSLFTCFLINAALVAAFVYLAQQVLLGFRQWIDPFLQQGAASLPEDVLAAFTAMSKIAEECQRQLLPVGVGVGAAVTFFLWLVLWVQGRSVARRAAREALSTTPERAEEPAVASRSPGAPDAATAPKSSAVGAEPSPLGAVQVLSILQREGRFVDFLQEDLSLYDDSQIGAAVRGIHEGCRRILTDYIQLKPVLEETEGSTVTVPTGFDANAVRLTGSVTGDPPFTGVLRHRGWKVIRVDLPRLTAERKDEWVLAPAEVEIET